MKKQTLVSGITATGNLTIGNYLGAIKSFIEFQDEYNMFIFVADLHGLTLPIEPSDLKSNKLNIMALYLAAGLDPKKVVLFNQSDVSAHSTLG
jgi:tryptophanyl-tRNA synthetase